MPMYGQFDSLIAAVSADEKLWGPTLKELIDKASGLFSFPELHEGTRRKDCWEAVLYISKNSHDSTIIKDCFIFIRVLSREKYGLPELINEEWREMIKKYSGLCDPNFEFNDQSTAICVEVLKILSNIMFNCRSLAEDFGRNDILKGLQRRIKEFTKDYKNKKIPEDIRFYDVKLLFLITALNSSARKDVQNMLETLTDLLVEVLKEAVVSPPVHLMDFQVDLVNEVLKALFNITLNTDELNICYYLVSSLHSFLLISCNNPEKTWALRNNIINLLTNMPEVSYKALILPADKDHKVPKSLIFEEYDMTAFHEILMFLKSIFDENQEMKDKNEILSPVLSVMFKGASSHRPVRKFLRYHILPPLTDVHTRPEEGNTIRNHLCKLLTTPVMNLRNLVAELLFLLCKKNVSRMIKYTGYGNAAGLFAQRGLLAGGRFSEENEFSSGNEDSETEEYSEHKHGINPVIGCYEEPNSSGMENMSEEQKEYEAMKLVELMDSLMKCGTIKPCTVGEDGKPKPINHILELRDALPSQQVRYFKDDSDKPS